MRIVLKKYCPRCKDTHYTRISRSAWMRFFKRSHLYRCIRCGTEYLVLFAKY